MNARRGGRVPIDIKERIKARGRWTAFLQYRFQLKEQGVPAHEATQQAIAKYDPIYEMEKDRKRILRERERVKKLGLKGPDNGKTQKKIDNIFPPLPAAEEEKKTKPKPKPKPEPEPPVASKPEPAEEPAESNREPRKEKKKGKKPRRKASVLAVVEWVADNISAEEEELNKDDAPSSAAWSLLQWVREYPTNQTEFWRIWSKLLPSRQQIETEARFKDDGRPLLDLIETVRREAESEADAGLRFGNNSERFQ